MLDSNITTLFSSSIDTITFDRDQLVVQDNGNIYRLGYISSTGSQNTDWDAQLAGKTISNLNITNYAYINLNNATTTSVTNLNVGANGTLIINSAFANHPNLSAQGGTTYINTSAVIFASVDIGTSGSATVTADSFTSTWNGSNYSASPAPGNGRLIIYTTGSFTVGSQGIVHMDAKGYPGGVCNSSYVNGYSVNGPGTLGGGVDGGGSYASQGDNQAVNQVFGSSDFWTELYLGSGGSCRYNHTGGAGGGAIKIVASSFSNSGTIRANGADGGYPSYWGGRHAGSGGTLIIDAYTFDNQGTLQTNGGSGGGFGRIGVFYTEDYLEEGTISPEITCDGVSPEPICAN